MNRLIHHNDPEFDTFCRDELPTCPDWREVIVRAKSKGISLSRSAANAIEHHLARSRKRKTRRAEERSKRIGGMPDNGRARTTVSLSRNRNLAMKGHQTMVVA